ncbi:MAG: sigma-70 family RNA polymerase sigma factor [Bacteroidales bacterium]|nr:sigma-70 family RNA polymerase sigma factor [Bacteroidales bacterium]
MSSDVQNDFLLLVKENQKIITKYCLMYTSDLMPFDDLYQETIYNLWKSFKSFRGKCKLSTWVYRVTINTCITYVRLKYKRVPLFELGKASDIPEDIAVDDHTSELYMMISQLSLIDRSIVMLWLDGNSYSDIAETLGMSETNVGSRLNRAKDKLKKMFNQEK